MSDRGDKWARCPRCKGTRGVGTQTGGFPEYNKSSCPCGWEGREVDLLPREPEKPEPLGFRAGVPKKSVLYTDVSKLAESLPDKVKERYAGARIREDWYEKVHIQGGSSDRLLTEARCGKYVGDNDGTCPQLTCVREKGHPGLCDNVSDLDDETHEVVVRNGVVEEVHVYCPRGSNVDVHVGRTASGALQTRTEVDGELYEETLGPIRVQSIKATTRKLRARWSAVPADEVFDKEALAAAFESEKEARALTMDEIVAVQPMTAPVKMEIEVVYQPSAAVVGKRYFITYKVPAVTGDEKLEAGPYETIEEARHHYSEIFNYEGVEQVEIVGRDIAEAKP